MWYRPLNESSIVTPCVLLYPDRIEENIRRMIAIAGSAERLRPHVKTHKIAEVIKLQLSHNITKFKCATLSESEMVAVAGGQDVLLAYPLLGPGTGHFLQLMVQYTECRFSVTVDSIKACQLLSQEAEKKGLIVNVFIDLDTGMHRTGIAPGKSGELLDYILKDGALRLEGLHIYDGHIHEVDFDERKAHCETDFRAVKALLDELKENGVEIHELACGGTPTFPIHALDTSRTLCPGTPLLWDAGYAKALPDLDFLPAAVIAGRVISRPGQGVCLDLGYKALASEMAHPRVHFLNMKVVQVLNHSEEHLVVQMDGTVETGDLAYALPTHICPTMALHEFVYVVKENKVADTWKVVARKRFYGEITGYDA